MDGSRFDELTRALATGATRRHALKILLGGAAALVGRAAAGAAEEGEKAADARRGPYWRAGKRCNTPEKCGALAPCTNGRCTPDHCYIDEDPVAPGTQNPANTCEWCLPSALWNGWGGVTGDGEACTVADPEPCFGTTGHCLANVCLPDPLPDGDLCEPGRTCCRGVCCSATQCCGESGACEECGPHCVIEGDPYGHLAGHPDGLCLQCDVDRDFSFWSGAPDKFPCGPNRDQVCCAGGCCDLGLCCDPKRGCAACAVCTIGGTEYDKGQVNPDPDQPCQVCDPSRSTEAWSERVDNVSCGASDKVCCMGVCCDPGECCQVGGCQAFSCEHCLIDGLPYPDNALNPANECEECRAASHPLVTVWTAVADRAHCGIDRDRVCCAGTCLPLGQCCAGSDGNREDGSCESGCTIDGVDYEEFDDNPDNVCQRCDPGLDPIGWSPNPENPPCGDNGDQRCCDGVCCPRATCCSPTELVCEQCRCLIGDAEYEDRAPNPDNECEICDLPLDPFAWTRMSEEASCGASGEQVCCVGVCCAEGECCTLEGVCESCGCEIDGVEHEVDAVNPANECQVCRPAASKTAWSPAYDDDPCGPNVDQVCCGGACCPAGQCCGDAGACEPCGCTIYGQNYIAGESHVEFFCLVCNPAYPTVWSPSTHPDCPPTCTIDGVLYANGAVNPANACERCDGGSSWSPSDALVCGQGQSCCGGSCCSPGECCTAAGVCGTDGCVVEGCVIGGVQYADGDVNPNDPCQACNESVSQSTWSSSNTFGSCGTTGEQYCAGGVCCGLGICPDDSQDVCGDYCDLVCVIGGVLYRSGDGNPDNDCEVCNSTLNHTAWSIYCSDACCAPLFCTHDAQSPCGPRD